MLIAYSCRDDYKLQCGISNHSVGSIITCLVIANYSQAFSFVVGPLRRYWMLYSFSIPLSDERSFLSCETHSILMSSTHKYNSFLRSFGQSKEKELPVSVVEDERKYALANKGIRVLDKQNYIVHDRMVIKPAIVFRRIFYNSCSARISESALRTHASGC